ncbi:group II intron-encoded protein LtrA [Microcystis aeruginosa NIES-2519]|uniref:Group II intron-encoded protein LtrA n=1 Tax=Microcystis aeruginosa NIES-2519 TaxID=2303981 RepID=A0A5A5R1R5_MICAE|nr:group II intron-encoded protein LtrA [Microcystis aeruginosa NIES-2519]CCI32048.1 RNA-directed DNA polymerase [Microcystis sp. T1-4]
MVLSSNEKVMNTATKPMYEWKDINWRKAERCVFKLSKRIFKASQRGDVKLVHKLQRLLLKSWYAKLIAVRRVSQDNQGKKTAGVDRIKSLTPKQRMALVNNLKPGNKSKPTRRVWIPKPNTDEKRPLGIPTMYERALQALVKLALEPEWEAKFEPNSYGFRPARSAHDAIGAIYISINKKPKYVLDADISKCFDKINHQKLLTKLQTYPKLRQQIKAWLKSGVMDGKNLFPTNEGTPQGGVISPLLANIALHGMEERVKQYARTLKGNKSKNEQALTLIRYADDFVILHEDLKVIKECQEIIKQWLAEMGLELKPSKTRISHTLETYDDYVGFDFLGFNIRQYQVGKHHGAKSSKGVKLGFKTLIKPSAEKVKSHLKKLGEVVNSQKSSPQDALIKRLNPIIRGWSNYYSSVVSSKTFTDCDYYFFEKLKRWAYRRHPMKNKTWIMRKYWHTEGKDNWVFSTRGGKNPFKLARHLDTKIVRYVKVKGDKSPYDGDLIYWSSRMGKHPEMPPEKAVLLKRQQGRCAYCGLYFQDGDILETDHIIPKSKGGKNNRDNKQLLHRHCHDSKTALDKTGTHDKEPLERGAV